jgi:hypothetical protein
MPTQLLEVTLWSDFVSAMVAKQLPMMYQEFSDRYEIYAIESVVWHITLLKNSTDAINFEKYYKVLANTGNYYQGVRLATATGTLIGTPNEGNWCGVAVSDVESQGILKELLVEAKKLNLFFEHITGLEIQAIDVEDT